MSPSSMIFVILRLARSYQLGCSVLTWANGACESSVFAILEADAAVLAVTICGAVCAFTALMFSVPKSRADKLISLPKDGVRKFMIVKNDVFDLKITGIHLIGGRFCYCPAYGLSRSCYALDCYRVHRVLHSGH